MKGWVLRHCYLTGVYSGFLYVAAAYRNPFEEQLFESSFLNSVPSSFVNEHDFKTESFCRSQCALFSVPGVRALPQL